MGFTWLLHYYYEWKIRNNRTIITLYAMSIYYYKSFCHYYKGDYYYSFLVFSKPRTCKCGHQHENICLLKLIFPLLHWSQSKGAGAYYTVTYTLNKSCCSRWLKIPVGLESAFLHSFAELLLGSRQWPEVSDFVLARWGSQKTHGLLRITRNSVLFSNGLWFFDLHKMQDVWHKSNTSGHCL